MWLRLSVVCLSHKQENLVIPVLGRLRQEKAKRSQTASPICKLQVQWDTGLNRRWRVRGRHQMLASGFQGIILLKKYVQFFMLIFSVFLGLCLEVKLQDHKVIQHLTVYGLQNHFLRQLYHFTFWVVRLNLKIKTWPGGRDSLDVRSSFCSSRGPGFESQHPQGGSECASVSGDLVLSSGLHGHCTVSIYT